MPDKKTFDSPMRKAILDHISSANGRPVTRTDLLLLFPATTDALANAHAELVDEHLRALVTDMQIVNIAPAGSKSGHGYWVMAAAFATTPKPTPDVEAVVDADDAADDDSAPPPAWAGQPAGPRQYDVMRDPVYVPPPSMRQGGSSVRPGADDFLACPSLVNGQRQAHHTHYIAALPSGHNPDSLPL